MDDNHMKRNEERLDFLLKHSGDPLYARETLEALFGWSFLTSAVLSYRGSVSLILRNVWGESDFNAVQSILNTPDPTPQQLETLTDLLHDHVPHTIEILPVLEAVSYLLGNDNLFGEPFKDSRLRDAAEIPF